MRLATSRCSLADMLGMTTRIMAARRRRRAIWTSCFHSCWRAFADIRCALRHDAMSATCCGARVTAGSKPGDDTRCLELAGLGFLSCSVRFFAIKSSLRCVSGCCCCIGGCHTHVHNRTAVVKGSACLDCVSVSPLGSVVLPGSASPSPLQDGVNGCTVLPGGFGAAARFSVLKVSVKE